MKHLAPLALGFLGVLIALALFAFQTRTFPRLFVSGLDVSGATEIYLNASSTDSGLTFQCTPRDAKGAMDCNLRYVPPAKVASDGTYHPGELQDWVNTHDRVHINHLMKPHHPVAGQLWFDTKNFACYAWANNRFEPTGDARACSLP